MEYKDLHDVLYDALYQIFPTVIIDKLIFKYIVNYNRYVYKCSILCNEWITNCHFNKPLNILCYNTNYKPNIIDIHTGQTHDNSLIDVKSFDSCAINKNDLGIDDVIHFNDNTLIVRQLDKIHRYILNDTKYVQTNYISLDRIHNVHWIIYNNYLYAVVMNANNYYIITYDSVNFNVVRKSNNFGGKGDVVQITMFNNVLYIYTTLMFDDVCHIYAHNIDNFYRFHQHSTPDKYLNSKLYNNKLYQYDHTSANLYVYDIITMDIIYSFSIQTTYQSYYYLSISNDILVLSNDKEMILYDIK
jgi:hypothetical protein